MPHRVTARIGPLTFPEDYSDPAVDVDTQANTVEHNTVTEKTIIQKLGRRPDQLRISGVLPEPELSTLDDLVADDVITIRTERWQGSAIVTDTTTNFMRAKDGNYDWLYEVTITALEVDEGVEVLMDEAAPVGTTGGTGGLLRD